MELELIEWLRRELPPAKGVALGIGDDAAVIDWARRGDCVATSDMLMDGVDFELAKTSPRRIGRKALAVNLSDLAAMAAKPVAGLVSLALPRENGFFLAKELLLGMRELAAEYSLAIVGGDTNSWAGPLVISITAIGETTSRGPLTRCGAKPGDILVATGEFGGSILGKHFDFSPRVREALWLAENFQLHAGIDVSDGLSLDLWRMCRASGCGAELDLETIPVSGDALRAAAEEPEKGSSLERALGDGEDFELLLAVPPEEALRMVGGSSHGTRFTALGRFVASPGLWQVDAEGARSSLQPRGYEHTLGS